MRDNVLVLWFKLITLSKKDPDYWSQRDKLRDRLNWALVSSGLKRQVRQGVMDMSGKYKKSRGDQVERPNLGGTWVCVDRNICIKCGAVDGRCDHGVFRFLAHCIAVHISGKYINVMLIKCNKCSGVFAQPDGHGCPKCRAPWGYMIRGTSKWTNEAMIVIRRIKKKVNVPLVTAK